MEMMTTREYAVTVEREGRWWVFTIPELDTVGQARALSEVPFEATGIISAWQNVPMDDIAVNITVNGPETVLAEWAAAAQDDAAARMAQSRAASRRRGAVTALRQMGWTAADTGQVLGISKQRVYQIEKADTAPAHAR
jgi:hypothetical protein